MKSWVFWHLFINPKKTWFLSREAIVKGVLATGQEERNKNTADMPRMTQYAAMKPL